MTLFGGLLVFLALAAACALLVLATLLRRETTSLTLADERMRASLRAKVAVLWFVRASDLALSEGSPAARQQQAQAESDLRSALAETRRLATFDRVAEFDSLARKGDAYIALRDRLDSAGVPLGTVLKLSTPDLEAVLADLQQLIAADDAWARTVETAARRWGVFATVVGVSVAALLVVGFAAAIVGINVLAERPILALTAAMGRFAEGDESSRSLPCGARELRQMATTFNQMADRLVRQNQERLAAISGVAHDLRNPLSALRLATGAVHRGQQPVSPERAEWALEKVGRQVGRLDRMVGDLLDATRVEAGRLELRLEIVDLRVLAGHVAELLGPVTTHELVVRAPEQPLLLRCDPLRIEQVLTNLVSNAIKYSPGDSRVTVTLATEGDQAIAAVEDRGIGISPEERERIFEPFHRADRSRDLAPGVGLGLSVARKLVEAHGGRIEVESAMGHGSTFRIRLPCAGP